MTLAQDIQRALAVQAVDATEAVLVTVGKHGIPVSRRLGLRIIAEGAGRMRRRGGRASDVPSWSGKSGCQRRLLLLYLSNCGSIQECATWQTRGNWPRPSRPCPTPTRSEEH